MRKQWKADKQNKTNSLPNIIVPHVLLASSMVCDDLVLQSSLHRIGRTEGTLFKLFTKLIFSCYISIFFITHRWIICRFSFCLNSRSLWMEWWNTKTKQLKSVYWQPSTKTIEWQKLKYLEQWKQQKCRVGSPLSSYSINFESSQGWPATRTYIFDMHAKNK